MELTTMHKIKKVTIGSIAQELEIKPGDSLISIKKVNSSFSDIETVNIIDILDYRFLEQEEELLLEIQKPNGEIWELEIEKDSFEELGLEFELPLMSEQRTCENKCVFCFIDQQPKGLRDSLYIKDDDPRESFLIGNYVTLTNLSDDEVKRLAGYHISPLRISIHAADLKLREKMLNNKNAKNIFHALNIFKNAGIEMHFQVVLCKGLNDGRHLDYTIEKLLEFHPNAKSLAVVPAGITRHREGLYPLEQFSKEEAFAVIYQIMEWQEVLLENKKYKTMFVFLSDEWYILAGMPVPQRTKEYEDFPQLDNGVGMIYLFSSEFKNSINKSSVKTTKVNNYRHIGIVTGKAASGLMMELSTLVETNTKDLKITVYVIENNFFGKNITVSGLLTGADIIQQLKNRLENEIEDVDVLFIPENAFRVGTTTMLDDTTLKDLEEAFQIPVKIGSCDGGIFHSQLVY